jgi:hypothetical protein
MDITIHSPARPPRRIQAWRDVNELPDREPMRDGRWLETR